MSSIHRLDIAITTKCNFTCPYCRGEPGCRETLPLNEAKTVIKNFAQLGVTHIRLDGGEPFLVGEAIFELIELAQADGLRVGIYTNASAIDAPVARRLATYPELELIVTLHCLNRPAELQATLRGLTILAEHAMFPDLVVVATRHLRKIRSTLERLPEHRYQLTFRPLIPVGKAFELWDKGFAPLSLAESAELKAEIDALSRAFPRLQFACTVPGMQEDLQAPGYHKQAEGFVLHVDTDANVLASFSAGEDKRLGSALDLVSLRQHCLTEEGASFLARADRAILERITNPSKPVAANIRIA
jgi:MoaA/NifB/PqqE/SkfB family radical SAM enzyme